MGDLRLDTLVILRHAVLVRGYGLTLHSNLVQCRVLKDPAAGGLDGLSSFEIYLS